MKATRKRASRRPVRPMTREAVELVAARFRAMGEPLRLRILQQLEEGEQSVNALALSVESTQPNVSKHLKVLQDAGLIKRRTQGTSAYYAIADSMVFELCDMICTRLRDRLEAQVGALNAGRRSRSPLAARAGLPRAAMK
jgi:DNA-binding transcriptional ArsR family regulator